jgi:hypothetical protein
MSWEAGTLRAGKLIAFSPGSLFFSPRVVLLTSLPARSFASRIRKQAGSKLSVLGRRGDVAA